MGGADKNGTVEGGYWRRLMRRLTSDLAELDADDLSRQAAQSGAARACDCRSGQEVTVHGRLRSVELSPRDAVATLEAELYDGTEGVTLVWLGRRRIPGIEPGRTLRASGRLAMRDGRKVLYNPYYELQTTHE
ncbi:DNA-binding protein [Pseudonocardiaceae bacterium YIM PH 21723]|nr:DNA-binding protein [Pseudonocardiaceae bacterium YIM PH 21723]